VRLVPEKCAPVVYGEYDAGAEKTVIIYIMYDVQPAEDVELWKVPPFGSRIVEMTPFKKLLMARGAVNSKGRDNKMLSFGTSFNLDGIWGGWTGPGSKTFVPHMITSKHNIRFVPNQKLKDLYRRFVLTWMRKVTRM
jgi:hypothetical protein